MKKTITVAIAFASVVMLFTACKKEDRTPTTTERVQQKWTFEKTYYHEETPGYPSYRDTTIGGPGQYIDFRNDNKAYSYTGGYYDTIPYSIINDTKMLIDGDTASIVILNDTQFQLHISAGDYPTEYYEASVYLTK